MVGIGLSPYVIHVEDNEAVKRRRVNFLLSKLNIYLVAAENVKRYLGGEEEKKLNKKIFTSRMILLVWPGPATRRNMSNCF